MNGFMGPIVKFIKKIKIKKIKKNQKKTKLHFVLEATRA